MAGEDMVPVASRCKGDSNIGEVELGEEGAGLPREKGEHSQSRSMG